MITNVRAAIVGATGFTGMVLTEILGRHPGVDLCALTSTSFVDRTVADVFPAVRAAGRYTEYSPGALEGCDVAFVCYPHAEALPVVARELEAGRRVVDLSADFRLHAVEDYPRWYGHEHARPDLLAEAVYGLPERYRARVEGARLVANPGCYPTASILAAMPLLAKGGVAAVIVDAKSGVSGAGRSPSATTHFSRVHDDFRAYGEVGHRHTAELLQEMRAVAATALPVSFTPHLLPIDRGILATVYLVPAAGARLLGRPALLDLYRETYDNEPFVEVVETSPGVSEVRGTNFCRVCPFVDEDVGVYKIVAVIDNLVKGASGQAVQNMNLMFGLPEGMGLGVAS